MSKLLCPFCESKVYDNRKNKKNPKSPDFVCSNNNSDSCDGHTGKYRKAWWLNSRDLPSGWINEGSKNKKDKPKYPKTIKKEKPNFKCEYCKEDKPGKDKGADYRPSGKKFKNICKDCARGINEKRIEPKNLHNRFDGR